MIILGIDPGLANCGYGVVSATRADLTCLDMGSIQTLAKQSQTDRLGRIYESLGAVVERYPIETISMESLFFASNAKSAMIVGQVCGVIGLLAHQKRLPLFAYTPLQIKQSIACYGRADKEQMKKMVQLLLKLATPIPSDHVADALSAAVCHAHQRPSGSNNNNYPK